MTQTKVLNKTMNTDSEQRDLSASLIAHEKVSKHDFEASSGSKRISAALIDSVIYTPLNMGVITLLNAMDTPYAYILALFVSNLIYFVFPTFLTNQTIGKKLMKIQVLPFSTQKTQQSFFKILMRENIYKFLSAVPLFMGYLWGLFREDKRTWHDFLASTKVVDIE